MHYRLTLMQTCNSTHSWPCWSLELYYIVDWITEVTSVTVSFGLVNFHLLLPVLVWFFYFLMGLFSLIAFVCYTDNRRMYSNVQRRLFDGDLCGTQRLIVWKIRSSGCWCSCTWKTLYRWDHWSCLWTLKRVLKSFLHLCVLCFYQEMAANSL